MKNKSMIVKNVGLALFIRFVCSLFRIMIGRRVDQKKMLRKHPFGQSRRSETWTLRKRYHLTEELKCCCPHICCNLLPRNKSRDLLVLDALDMAPEINLDDEILRVGRAHM